jgi:hypothetical protein
LLIKCHRGAILSRPKDNINFLRTFTAQVRIGFGNRVELKKP